MKKPPNISADVLRAYDELYEVEWFRNVGRAQPQNALAVRTWEEAQPYVDKLESENVRIEAANTLRVSLLEQKRLAGWNDVVERIRPVAIALVSEKAKSVIEVNGWSPKAFARARWDVLHLGLELHYAAFVEPGFYLQLAYWYREGHFPLGWEGPIASGQLVVF